MQAPYIERNPVTLDNFSTAETEDSSRSSDVFGGILSALQVFEKTYGMGTDAQASFSDQDFLGWLEEHKAAMGSRQYETRRGVGEVALVMGLEGPHQIGLEVAGQDVLEVGPGSGVFAGFLSRNAKSLMLVDSRLEVLGIAPDNPKVQAVLSPIQAADLAENSFDKTFDISAALTWGADMRSTTMAFYRELHLTKVGGSLFAVPLFATLIQRAHQYLDQDVSSQDIPPSNALRDFRDYTLGRGLIRVMSEGLVSATFGINVWDKAEDDTSFDGWGEQDDYASYDDLTRYFDSAWGVLDKVKQVPSLPPEDLLLMGYALQDGEKIASTIKDETGITIPEEQLAERLNLPAYLTN
jgi:hypothetical protein